MLDIYIEMVRSLKKTASASRKRAYAKRRRASVCATKKGARSCKNMSKKCSWAKGSKRSFCRRRTNKKH